MRAEGRHVKKTFSIEKTTFAAKIIEKHSKTAKHIWKILQHMLKNNRRRLRQRPKVAALRAAPLICCFFRYFRGFSHIFGCSLYVFFQQVLQDFFFFSIEQDFCPIWNPRTESFHSYEPECITSLDFTVSSQMLLLGQRGVGLELSVLGLEISTSQKCGFNLLGAYRGRNNWSNSVTQEK